MGCKGDVDVQSEWIGGLTEKGGVGAYRVTEYGRCTEMWSSGEHSACRKLESAEMRVGRRLLGASNTVARVAVQGDLGWRKLEERREEIGGDGRESTDEDSSGETKRGWKNRLMGRG